MAGFENPLREKPVQILSGCFLDRRHELIRIDRLKRVFVEKVGQRALKRLVAHDPAQHVQNDGAFRIRMTVEIIIRKDIAIKHDGTLVAIGGFAQISVFLFMQIQRAFVLAEIVFRKKIFTVSCKTFINPRVAPRAHRDKITPPLMRGFMRHQPMARKIFFGLFIVNRALPHHRCRCALRAPTDARNRNLIVFHPRISKTVFFIKEGNNLRRFTKRAHGLFRRLRINPVVDR